MLKKLFCLSLALLVFKPATSLHGAHLKNFSPEQTHLHRSAAAPSRSSSNERRGRRLWPGSRFTEAARKRAVSRGLNFIYRTALVHENFKEYGHDYLWCFYTLSVALKDRSVTQRARQMGIERARAWRRAHRFVPADMDAGTIANLIYGQDAADSLGVRDEVLKGQLRRASVRFSARDFLLFDPLREAPPADVPNECSRCGAHNARGRNVCFVCKTPLVMRTRYDVWYDALITAYVGERSGIPLGARYADVLKWLPTLRPYRARAADAGEEFHDTVYAITHIVYTLNDYNRMRLSTHLLPQEFEFLKANLKEAIKENDADMLGEFMDSLRAFGMTTEDELMRAGMEYYLTHQNPDGSWGNVNEKDIYMRYHPTWNAIAGLSEYSWQGEGLSFPELKPLLERWAKATEGN